MWRRRKIRFDVMVLNGIKQKLPICDNIFILLDMYKNHYKISEGPLKLTYSCVASLRHCSGSKIRPSSVVLSCPSLVVPSLCRTLLIYRGTGSGSRNHCDSKSFQGPCYLCDACKSKSIIEKKVNIVGKLLFFLLVLLREVPTRARSWATALPPTKPATGYLHYLSLFALEKLWALKEFHSFLLAFVFIYALMMILYEIHIKGSGPMRSIDIRASPYQ